MQLFKTPEPSGKFPEGHSGTVQMAGAGNVVSILKQFDFAEYVTYGEALIMFAVSICTASIVEHLEGIKQ